MSVFLYALRGDTRPGYISAGGGVERLVSFFGSVESVEGGGSYSPRMEQGGGGS